MPRGDHLRQKSVLYRRAKQLARARGEALPSWRESSINELQNFININTRNQPLLDALRTRRTYTRTTRTLRDRSRITSYQYEIDPTILISPGNLEKIKKLLLSLMRSHRGSLRGGKTKIEVKDNILRQGLSIPFLSGSISHVVNEMMVRNISSNARSYSDFYIKIITIETIKTPENLMGNATRSIVEANKQWLIVSTKSKFNCAFQAVAVAKNFRHNRTLLERTKEGQKARVKSAKEMKRTLKKSFQIMDNYADNQTLQALADYTKYPIQLYNNVFRKIKLFTPKVPLTKYRGIKVIELQNKNQHCIALIRKNLILESYPDFIFPTNDHSERECETRSTELSDNVKIPKKEYFHKYNSKIATFDIETSTDKNGKHIPYAVSICWRDEYIELTHELYDLLEEEAIREIIKQNSSLKLNEKQFWGLDCLQQLTKFIYDNKDTFNNFTLYAHNGGKYDMPLMIEKSFLSNDYFYIEGKGCVELNNAWIGFTLRAKDDRTFKLFFRDSFRLLPMSLDKLTKELKVKHQKLTETIKHEQITLINYNEMKDKGLSKYLSHDVKGLLEVLEVFGKGVWGDLKIDITKCYTGASLSKINFFKNYYNGKFKPVYKLSDENDKFVRDSYFGGRVECFKMGEIKKCYYYDFTSLYPDVGRKNLPYDNPEMIDFNQTKIKKVKTDKIKLIIRVRGINLGCYYTGEICRPLELTFPNENAYDDFIKHKLKIEMKKFHKNYLKLGKEEFIKNENKNDYFRKQYTREMLLTATTLPFENVSYRKKKIYDDVEYKTTTTKLPEDFFGWVRCKVKTRDYATRELQSNEGKHHHIPKHAVLKDDRLIFPNFTNWTEITLFSEELDYEQYEYEFIRGLKFNKAKFLKRFFDDGFMNKAKAKAEGNPAMAQAYKIIINSGYGFWGLRTKNRDGVIINESSSNSYLKYLKEDKLIGIMEKNGYKFCRVLKDLNVKDFNVAVAAAISSYARIKLHKLLSDIKKVGGEVYYCDTDSVICNINLKDYPELQQKHQWDGNGEELGSLKNECDEVVEKKLKQLFPNNPEKRKKIFEEMIEKENGNLSFDNGIITGCKQYALYKDIEIDGKTHRIEIVKLKGYSQKDEKLTYSDMENLNTGTKKTQTQTQFNCPKSNFISETHTFNIKSKKIVKSFKRTYTKGNVDGNDIKPIEL